MSASAPALRAEHIRVSYEIRSVRERVRFGRRAPMRVEALRDVDFHLDEGETVGVIGINGAGKSTLLKVLMGVLTPDSGTVWATSVPFVLSLGGLLSPRYTGRVNIEVALMALGWPPKRIAETVQPIIDFSELGPAIDRPLGTYSSGMQARLKFAIATSASPEILLIDEALAVGDEGFRSKSEQKLSELTAESSAIVLVTHNLTAVRKQCDRVAWIHDGVVHREGTPDDVVDEYIEVVRGGK